MTNRLLRLHHVPLAVLFAGLSLSQVACAKADERATGEAFADAAATEPPPSDEGTFAPDAGVEQPVPSEDCAEETKQIFVLATDKALYRFNPPTTTFTRIGQVACPTAAGTFSMAIDRRGTAWVEYTDGSLFAVDTRNATCKPTPFKAGQTGFTTFGMGFAKDSDTGTAETLFVSGDGLAALDTKSFQLKFLGSLTYGRTELTAMDQQLFAFSVESGVVARLDKANAATQKVYRTSAVDPAAAFAFAQWGGEFWIFTGTTTTTVTRYSPDTDTSLVAMPNAGILIVGAGSSTCAPSKLPN
jgi:hypothetical protein